MALEGFYVTVVRGGRVGYLVGPLPTLTITESWVPPAREEAGIIDPWTHFDAFGVTRMVREAPHRPLPPGVLNDRLGYTPA